MSRRYWPRYVSVAKQRAVIGELAAKAQKAGEEMIPAVVEGRTIAKTFWGKAWCDNLEAYSDYENRLPRGRTYLRNGAVIDLKIEPGKVRGKVVGSSLYTVEIDIAAVPEGHWRALVKECTGSIASLVELLQGRFSKAVMERICHPKTGLFPAPREIRFACTCPDWATMCKHVAAVLYGVGARLDAQPDLLFTLRQVNADDLVTQAVEQPVKTGKAPARGKILDEALLADVFGIEMATADARPVTPGAMRRARKSAAQPEVEPAAPAGTAAKVKAAANPTPRKGRATPQTPSGQQVARPAKAKEGSRQAVPNGLARRKRKAEPV